MTPNFVIYLQLTLLNILTNIDFLFKYLNNTIWICDSWYL